GADMKRFQELTSKYLEHTAGLQEEVELMRVLETDAAARAKFLSDYEMDQMLDVLHTPANEDSIDAILTRLRAESDPFVEAVARETRQTTVGSAQVSASWRKNFEEWLRRPRVVFGLSGTLAVILLAGLMIWLFGPTMGEPILA